MKFEFLKEIASVNDWNISNVRWIQFPFKNDSPRGNCKMNLGFNYKRQQYQLDPTRWCKIEVFANNEIESVFFGAHELYHYLVNSKQVAGLNIEIAANMFALRVTLLFLMKEGLLIDTCSCGESDFEVSYDIKCRYSAELNLLTNDVLTRPHVESLDLREVTGIEIKCINCGKVFLIEDKETREQIINLLKIYDYGIEL